MLKTNRNQQGVTLVEAMIALLVISIGLLGIASLFLYQGAQFLSSLIAARANSLRQASVRLGMSACSMAASTDNPIVF